MLQTKIKGVYHHQKTLVLTVESKHTPEQRTTNNKHSQVTQTNKTERNHVSDERANRNGRSDAD